MIYNRLRGSKMSLITVVGRQFFLRLIQNLRPFQLATHLVILIAKLLELHLIANSNVGINRKFTTG